MLRLGLVLIVLGIGGYVASDMVSPTALIPAAFGLVMLMLGLRPRAEPPGDRDAPGHGDRAGRRVRDDAGRRRAVALGAGTRRPAAVAPIARALMATLIVIYLVTGIGSFIAACRK